MNAHSDFQIRCVKQNTVLKGSTDFPPSAISTMSSVTLTTPEVQYSNGSRETNPEACKLHLRQNPHESKLIQTGNPITLII